MYDWSSNLWYQFTWVPVLLKCTSMPLMWNNLLISRPNATSVSSFVDVTHLVEDIAPMFFANLLKTLLAYIKLTKAFSLTPFCVGALVWLR